VAEPRRAGSLLVRTSPLQSERSLVSEREPVQESMQRFKMKVGNLLVPGNNDPWPEVRDTLNRRGLKSSLSFVLHLE